MSVEWVMAVKNEKPFFLEDRSQLPALEAWLKDRTFNCGGYFRSDSKGNPMFSIGWDWKPESDWSIPDKRGLVIVCDPAARDDVEALIARMASTADAGAP